MRTKTLLITAIIVLGLLANNEWAQAGGGWVFYWDGSYHGKVIDADTKEPIEEAVVVAVYHENCYGIVQTISGEIGVQEVLTDVQGYFLIPTFWRFGLPFCWFSHTKFFVFKPGHGSFPGSGLIGETLPLEPSSVYFKTKIYSPDNPNLKHSEDMFKTGVIVELPKLKTAEELRRYPVPNPVTSEYLRSKLKEFLRLESERDKKALFKP